VISPKLVEVGRHLNTELLTNTELLGLDGKPGAFKARVRKNPRYVITFLSKPEIKLSAITAKLDADYCVKCLTCVRSCPFEVPQYSEKECEVLSDEALCQGCGVCTAVCPRQSINLSKYEDDQIMCKIECLLE
jgi:heterodisulfide reductase subunit A-like polyferredoxin